jgi:uncharacterized membrane protein
MSRQPKSSVELFSKSQQPSGISITAFVLGLMGFVFSWIPTFGWVLNILAIIFASVSLKQDKVKGFSIVALILGIIGICIWLLATAFSPYFLGSYMGMLGMR